MNALKDIFRRVRWRLRAIWDVPTSDEHELSYRLNRLSLRVASGQRFRFPWGAVEFQSGSDLRGQYAEIFLRRHYAFRAARPDPVIIDAGGNIGMSAIWFKREYPRARVKVFEADPELAKVLQSNLSAAEVEDVHVENAAVWIADGTVTFDNRGEDKGTVSEGAGIPVRAVDLAAHLPEKVDLLKLDVEGAEYPIIERLHATGCLHRIQHLVAEFHVRRGDVDKALRALAQLRDAGMKVSFTSMLGPWLGAAEQVSAYEAVGRDQTLMEVHAWR
jgi:FkbM family methyltransferase